MSSRMRGGRRRCAPALVAMVVAAATALAAVPLRRAEAAPSISVRKPDSGIIEAVFLVSLSVVETKPVTVQFFTSDGTATGGVDYVPAAGRLVFRPGETRKLVSVGVIGNTIPEGDRTFFFNLESANAQLVDLQQMATIVDDHPFIEMAGTSITEGDAGTREATLVVELSEPGTRPVWVDFATADGTASAGLDYVGVTGTLSFAPGETSKVVGVPVVGDGLAEGDESFFVNLSVPLGGEIKRAQGLVTIVNDDATVSLGPPPPGSSAPVAPRGAVAVRPAGVVALTAAGQPVTFGAAPALPGGGLRFSQPVVGLAATPSGKGYLAAAAAGGVFALGDARFHGSTGGLTLNQPIVGMAGTSTGDGYWMVARDGGIFAFGDAGFFGSTGAIRLNQPIVGMAAAQSGKGYWLMAADGGVFAFGDAGFFGSTGAIRLNQPIVATAATPSGGGYWMVARDGGVFAFGDARFLGSTAALSGQPIATMAATPDGDGYWLMARNGDLFPFGEAPFFAPQDRRPPDSPVVAMTLTR